MWVHSDLNPGFIGIKYASLRYQQINSAHTYIRFCPLKITEENFYSPVGHLLLVSVIHGVTDSPVGSI